MALSCYVYRKGRLLYTFHVFTANKSPRGYMCTYVHILIYLIQSNYYALNKLLSK